MWRKGTAFFELYNKWVFFVWARLQRGRLTVKLEAFAKFGWCAAF